MKRQNTSFCSVLLPANDLSMRLPRRLARNRLLGNYSREVGQHPATALAPPLDVKRPLRGCGAPKERVHLTSTRRRLFAQVGFRDRRGTGVTRSGPADFPQLDFGLRDNLREGPLADPLLLRITSGMEEIRRISRVTALTQGLLWAVRRLHTSRTTLRAGLDAL